MTLDNRERTKLLSRVCQLVHSKHFNPGLSGINWDALVRDRRDEILSCTQPEAFEKEMQRLIAGLRVSHMGFWHKTFRNIPARTALNSTFQRIVINDVEHWMFQDVHQGPAYSAGIRPGDLLLESCGREIQGTANLTFPCGSTTVLIEKLDGGSKAVKVDVVAPTSKKRATTALNAIFGLRLSRDIGLLKIVVFPGVFGMDIAKDIDRLVSSLDGCNRLIIDLRGNIGGGIGGLRLMSYLTPGKVEVGYTVTKQRRESGYLKQELARLERIPAQKIALLWMLARYSFIDKSILLVTEGLGARQFQGRIVLLVNEHTASAGEMIAGFAKENKLATIVGTTTAGRLLSSTSFRVGRGYHLLLPVAAYYTSRGTMIENNGITPDVVVRLSREALKLGIDTQLEEAVEVIRRL